MARPESLKILCWASSTGRKPVKDWLADLDDISFRKVDKLLGLLRVLGRDLRAPHCRFLGDGLFELRDSATGPGFRVYYTWRGDVVVILLAGGDKGSQVQDIEIARQRQQDKG